MTRTPHPPLYVLAGGASRRFGSDKARAQVDGQSMLAQVIESLSPADTVTLVTGPTTRYAELGYPVITDDPCEVGPIGGLHAALMHRHTQRGPGWITLVSCDLVRPQRQWIDRLLSHADSKSPRPIAFFADRWEPMAGLYHTDLLTQINQQLAAGRHALHRLLEAADAVRVPMPDGLLRLPQANTRTELLEAINRRGAA